MAAGKIPATVVTGFLGAGKTTAIRHLLANAGGRRLALIINEFGEVGVDREILTGCGDEACREDDVVELANGCICCTVADDFLPTIRKLLDRADPPDHIVIETSGLALPKPLVKAFTWPEVRSRVTVDGVVALVDARALADGRFATDPEALAAQRAADPSLDHEGPLEELFEEQLGCADLVVLNKVDLLSDTERAEVEAGLREQLRPAARLTTAREGRVDARVMLGLTAAAEGDLDSRPSHHDGAADDHDHDDFTAFSVTLPEVESPAGLVARLQAVVAAHDVLRVKGFAAVRGKPMRLVVQGVGGRLQHYYDRDWRGDEPRRTGLVLIGEKGLDEAAIRRQLST